MIIQINFESDVPVYTQLYDQIILGIATEQLKPGEKLPSLRRLASDLGLATNTVTRAFNLLKDDGFVTTHKKKGMLITDKKDKFDKEYLFESFRPRLKKLCAEAICRDFTEDHFVFLCRSVYQTLLRARNV